MSVATSDAPDEGTFVDVEFLLSGADLLAGDMEGDEDDRWSRLSRTFTYVPSPLLSVSVDTLGKGAMHEREPVELSDVEDDTGELCYPSSAVANDMLDASHEITMKSYEDVPDDGPLEGLDRPKRKPRQWRHSSLVALEEEVPTAGKGKNACLKLVVPLRRVFGRFLMLPRISPTGRMLLVASLVCIAMALLSFAPPPVGITQRSGELGYAGKILQCKGVYNCICPRTTICAEDLQSLFLLGHWLLEKGLRPDCLRSVRAARTRHGVRLVPHADRRLPDQSQQPADVAAPHLPLGVHPLLRPAQPARHGRQH
eukprot:1991566-Pyramimonas_sp.AAC.2